MPPPAPSASVPLQERLMALAQTLQFAWFAGHLVSILCTLRYGFSYIRFNYYGRMAQFSYRTSFVAAALTYGIVVYKTQRARAKTGNRPPPSALSLLRDENVQYLIMALVWLFSPQYPLALLPYVVYSVFHVATYTRGNLIPTITPPPAASADGTKPKVNNALADKIGAFVKEYYDSSMTIVSTLEVALWFRVLVSAILFQRRSWILITLYTAFIRARFAQSNHIQNSFAQFNSRVESFISAQGTPPAARQTWDGIKGAAAQFHDLTDLSKYVGGAEGAKKTS